MAGSKHDVSSDVVSRNLRLYIVLIGAANGTGSFGAQLGSTDVERLGWVYR